MLASLLISLVSMPIAPPSPGSPIAPATAFPGPVPAISPSMEGPDAKAIVERAIAAQRAGKLALDVRDFEVRATLNNSDQNGRLTFDVDCRFKAPDKVWTDVTERAMTDKKFVEGFDGRTAWMKDGDGTTLYEGRDFLEDRKKLQETAQTMRRLLRFFFLENLAKDVAEWERLDDHVETNRDDVETRAYVVTGIGKNPESADAGMARVTLWVDQTKSHLLGVRLEPVEETNASQTSPSEGSSGGVLQFCFWFHRENPQGVIVPGSIKVYHDDEKQPSQILTLLVKDGKNDIRFNVGLKDELFSPKKG